MAMCGKCLKPVSGKAYVQCVNCETLFHTSHKVAWKKLTSSQRKEWRCDDCFEQQDSIAALTLELEEAKRRVEELASRLRELTRHTAFTPAKKAARKKPSVSLSTVATRNRFDALEEDEDSSPAPDRPTTPRRRPQRHRRRMAVVADSHGRDCGRRLREQINDDVDTCVYSLPGRRFGQIVAEAEEVAKHFSSQDHVLIMGGTNDFGGRRPPTFTKELNQLRNFKCKISLISVPYRCDRPELNSHIRDTNFHLEDWCRRHNMGFLNINQGLDSASYTRHGLHLNQRGKTKLCSQISQFVQMND